MTCRFFFKDTATTEIYTLSLHDALPISTTAVDVASSRPSGASTCRSRKSPTTIPSSARMFCQASVRRSEEHTSELQSRQYLVCRLLLEKKTYQLSRR